MMQRVYINQYVETPLNLLLISDIHFSNNAFIGTYDKTIKYDYFIYAGDLLRSNYSNNFIYTNIVNFINDVKAKKKIIILGNNDHYEVKEKLSKLVNCIIVYDVEIIDNMFCSPYSQSHNSSNIFGNNIKYIPTEKQLKKYNIFITHGIFSINKYSDITNKIFIFGHDHIFNSTNLSYITIPKYIIIDKNNNTFINVSVSEHAGLEDRDVYFTHLRLEANNKPMIQLQNKYNKNSKIRLEKYKDGSVKVVYIK